MRDVDFAAIEQRLLASMTDPPFDSPLQYPVVSIDPAGKDGAGSAIAFVQNGRVVGGIKNVQMTAVRPEFKSSVKDGSIDIMPMIERYSGQIDKLSRQMMTCTVTGRSPPPPPSFKDLARQMRDIDQMLRPPRSSMPTYVQQERFFMQRFAHGYRELRGDGLPNFITGSRLSSGTIGDFLWGPEGEWTGLVTPDEIRSMPPSRLRKGSEEPFSLREFIDCPSIITLTACGLSDGRRVDLRSLEMDRYRYDPAAYAPPGFQIDRHLAFQFYDYQSWAAYREAMLRSENYKISGGRQDQRIKSEPESREQRRLMDAIFVLRPERDRFEEWANQLVHTKADLAIGLLRDADDGYDPFGILAKLNGPEWVWDEHEGAYAVDGDCMFLKPATVKKWLGAKGDAKRLIETVTAIADGCTTLKQIGTALRDAHYEAMDEMERWREACRQVEDIVMPRLGSPHDIYRGPISMTRRGMRDLY